MKYVLCILIGYLIGAINPSYIIAKLRGFDIREKGSKNAGASNALILFGKAIGIGCALFDIAKATFVIWLCEKLFPELTYSLAVTGVACILGHSFPFYMKFKGGKGLACLGGMILAFDWRVFLIMLAAEIAVAILTDYICFVPLTASAIFPIVYGIMRHDVWGVLIIALILPLMLYKHRENLKRIKQKTEMPFSFLWNKDKALEKTNISKE
ncbi:MAG: glycerol-3-phosphate 1-O-acyltransferase PlsY [Ruminococcaceae bacterium]|nr:glycerol-3-phosphate 1-O-acyltransferase PlsY [Oscillospiraceae bacterium]